MQDSALAGLIAAFPQPVILIDTEGIVSCVNPAATDLFGVYIEGAHIRAHLRQPDVAAMLERVLAGRAEDSASFFTTTANQEIIWRVVARRADSKTIVLSLDDISDIESAEAQRRDFVANVSHELRSPLTVLAGFIETLQGPAGDDPAVRSEFLGIMAEQAGRMTGLVSDLLSLGRVEAVAKIRPRTPVAIDMVLDATIAALRPQFNAAQVELCSDIPKDLPEIPGDYDQLAQVFHNLIENGLKYGGSGGRLEIEARELASHPAFEGAVLCVCVRDKGDGIDAVHIPRLTERFYRVDKARSREDGGTGLGLAIVKHILSRHRGRLVIRSAPGKGATFSVLLPCF